MFCLIECSSVQVAVAAGSSEWSDTCSALLEVVVSFLAVGNTV